MVKYETRIFYEKDSKAMGADVLIYEDSNDEPIDRILITTESKYDELVARVDSVTTNAIDRETLLQIINNTTNVANEYGNWYLIVLNNGIGLAF